ncbi:MAG: DNA mismatch repair protein MutS [Muribaculaceae bacterium]|nr:DNA mismatch repair protein MutS [Muribaculaceae bacterium]
MAKIVETPLMKQYVEMKRKHPDAILLFRVGDFYETFSEDAIAASEILGITLTRRANGAASSVELAGFPHHALDTYLPKLVRAGKRVAICEQLEDPKMTKKLVKRGITELVTPGVAFSENILNKGENNFLAAVHFSRRAIGVAFLDVSTGEFLAAEGNVDYVGKLLGSFAPKEVLVENGSRRRLQDTFPGNYSVTELEDWVFVYEAAMERLLKQFNTQSLKGFGMEGMNDAVVAAGAVMFYLDQTHHTQTSHISALARIEDDKYVRLDRFTVRNLELTSSMSGDGDSLLSIINRTITPMGSRMLHRWLLFPLKDPEEINRRLDVVQYFFEHPDDREELKEILGVMGDLERLISRVAVGRATPRDLGQLRTALGAMASMKRLMVEADSKVLKAMGRDIDTCHVLLQQLKAQLVKEPPSALTKGYVIREGVSPELDELRQMAYSSKDLLLQIQNRESRATGIPSLKVAYNNVFGYYIEVTNTHKDKVPTEWIRKQTLVNAERYITPELKDLEEKILTAQDRIAVVEARLYAELVASVGEYISKIMHNAAVTAQLDVLSSFTRVAIENRYNRPVVDDSMVLDLVEARHPVIEKQMPPGESYISNSVHLDNNGTQVMIITGPNMSGKSALLRQTALNVIMAQIGCFVAAESARIGVVDKIFTRVGASDDISRGESTFMVEMTEAASILNNMSPRSLIIFDELGRGTSTYDGISIAWSIVEYIHEYHDIRPKTLFATHYHELNEMEKSFARIVNYNVSVKETDGKVVFMRKLAKGGSEHSFGLHVARLAGMPAGIVKRAETVLKQLEATGENRSSPTKDIVTAGNYDTGVQLSFFQLDDPVLSQLRDRILGLDINNLTPIESLNKLHEIRTILTGRSS